MFLVIYLVPCRNRCMILKAIWWLFQGLKLRQGQEGEMHRCCNKSQSNTHTDRLAKSRLSVPSVGGGFGDSYQISSKAQLGHQLVTKAYFFSTWAGYSLTVAGSGQSLSPQQSTPHWEAELRDSITICQRESVVCGRHTSQSWCEGSADPFQQVGMCPECILSQATSR